jgi:hypothetical protein
VVERRVCARHEVSGSNSDFYKCVNFVKKLCLGSRGACSGSRLPRVFFFFFLLLFSNFLVFILFSGNLFIGAG